MIQIMDFNRTHIIPALAIARQNYEEERKAVPVLPSIAPLPDLGEFSDNGLGVAAFIQGRFAGFLCCHDPWENAFTTTATGTFSPLHAHGAIKNGRDRIYRRLYQAAAEKWVRKGVSVHAIALYAHDDEGIRTFFNDGFGLRCIDAIRPMESGAIPAATGELFCELEKAQVSEIDSLRRMLAKHLGESPCFMKDTALAVEKWLCRARQRDSRVFIAKHQQAVIAFIEVADTGENFITQAPGMKNICGAYCLPQYRGKGVASDLLNYLVQTLYREGHTLLGVDFESFNPTASGFWHKSFTAYTNSVVRRIDESAFR